MYVQQHNRLTELRAQLDVAEQRLAETSKDLKAAERRNERASEVVGGLREEIALETLRQWGDKPDLAALLDARASTTVFYRALTALAEDKGLFVGGMWGDTKQHAMRFGLNRSELGAVERIADAIRYFAPAMKSIKGVRGGWVRFAVSHRDPERCAWELHFSPKKAGAQLARLTFGSIDEILPFTTLEAALRHVEEHLWLESVIDHLPDALEFHGVEEAPEH